MLRRWGAAAAGAVALAVVPVSRAVAQASAYAASVSELDSATSAGVLRELERASGRGLPTEPLLAKAREGRLKRAPGARIRVAVAALAARLDSARGALGPDASSDELVAGADAIAAGAGAEALRAVRAASTQRSVGVALGALTQLVASGVPPRRATSMIVDLLRRNASPALLVAFGNAVESDVAAGLPGAESAAFRLRSASASALIGAEALTSPQLPGAASNYPPVPSSTPPRRRP
jgi:hypothetical protein